MASSSISKSIKGFTLLESIVVLGLFVSSIVIASQIYFNLMRSVVMAQSYQLAFDNFRFGTERVWNGIKNGSNFVPSLSGIEFLDHRCRRIRIYPNLNNLIFEIDDHESFLFDNELVELQSFNIYHDNPVGRSGDPYYKTANKIFLINYKVNLKTKTAKIPLEVWQTVAPSNSVFLNNPCQ